MRWFCGKGGAVVVAREGVDQIKEDSLPVGFDRLPLTGGSFFIDKSKISKLSINLLSDCLPVLLLLLL